MAVVYLGNDKENISSLTKARPLASIPVGGSYRIIDFALSNLVHAGIRNIGLFSGDDELNSLMDHIGIGAEWDLARKTDGIFFFKQMMDNNYGLRKNRIFKNMEYFFRSSQDHVISMNGHKLYNIDLKEVIEAHEASGREITMVYKKVQDAHERFNHCSSVKIDPNNRVVGIGKNLFFQKEENISLDLFILSKELMIKLLMDSIQEGYYSTLSEIVAKHISSLNVNAFEFKGYLHNINSTREYFDFNQKLLNKEIREDILGEASGRKVITKIKDTPPSLFKLKAEVENSLVSNGCIIEGKIRNSILSRGTHIEEGAVVEDCVILQSCHIQKGVYLKNVIVDKNNVIREQERLAASPEYPLVIEKATTWEKNEYHQILKYMKKD